jgi:hypothetical protein
MDEAAKEQLWKALEIDAKYDRNDVPSADTFERAAFLWDELLEDAREDVRLDPNLLSFFVVTETRGTTMRNRYVSSDWPSAEEYAKRILFES